ncbi:MAG: valine--tRNA ligase [Kiritimatiellae bacterium]|jgi:valyl-tRNA synthetase|nr:valine--tRNA ligase [Kiritimatiellia bacterium]
MTMEKHYEPHSIEDKWYERWVEAKAFGSDSSKGGEPYCIMIPPPNVTGVLHMGHALNNTIQDIMARWRRMEGRNVVWVPGTDHAGIATQNVVERALKAEGKTRDDLGREAFLEKVWEWKEEYGGTIIGQLKKLGASCDWDRERFTMDEGLSDAVTEVFTRLYEKGLVYKGSRIVNWCPRCQTALSDEESEHEDENGHLWHIKYPVKGENRFVTVATTRPETMLGDVAVAVHPEDERYKDLIGKTIMLPIANREIVVIQDDYVEPEFGTGVVKITPAHDPNDFDMGNRHNLTPINVMNDDGTMNEGAGIYEGMDRFECRKALVKVLEEEGLLEKIDDHAHAVGHCYRCHTVVEPRLSPQWFVKMAPLAKPALEAVKSGRIEFVPARWERVYDEWLTNIRDWCISRQIWWGHRIPVFYCDDCGAEWVSKGKPETCEKCSSSNIRQDEDVLDTWFSSWLWPFSTLGWPNESDDLKFYYPTNDLTTASEIIFFWVARMVMAGIEFMGDIPFEKVYIHGTVRADDGRKMSKSLGNSINPLDIIEEFSADALRFSLIMLTATGQDVYISNEKFEVGRNFGTKIWNAARFMEMHKDKFEEDIDINNCEFSADLLKPDDKHILAMLDKACVECIEALEKYRFNDAAHVLYEFIRHQYCDRYLEFAKGALYGDDIDAKRETIKIMYHVFSASIRLLHPIMPFLTEELWHCMGYGDESSFVMLAEWPKPAGKEQLASLNISDEIVKYVEDKHDMIRVARTMRADYNIQPGVALKYMVKPNSVAEAELLKQDMESIKSLIRASEITIDEKLSLDQAVPGILSEIGTVFMLLDGAIDTEAEIKKLEKELNHLDGNIKKTIAKLNNENFVTRAPADVIDRQKELQQEMQDKFEKLGKQLGMLK